MALHICRLFRELYQNNSHQRHSILCPAGLANIDTLNFRFIHLSFQLRPRGVLQNRLVLWYNQINECDGFTNMVQGLWTFCACLSLTSVTAALLVDLALKLA